MKLRTTKSLIIELGQPSVSNKILLSGNDLLQEVVGGVDLSDTNIDNTFLKNFGLECSFLYSAALYATSSYCRLQEVGVGHLEIEGSTVFLCRDVPYYYVSDGELISSYNSFLDLQFDNKSEKLLLTNYSPQGLHELLVADNCLITSTDSYEPAVIQMQENSFLVRLDKGIESAKVEDLSNKDGIKNWIKDTICNYTKQIVLKTSKLDAKTIGVSHLILKPTKKPLAKKGELYYDESLDRLKFYDGKQWRTISYEDP
jgi:hypothetical protein